MLKIVSVPALALLITMSATASIGAEHGRERHDKELIFGISGLDNIGLNTFDGDFGMRYFIASALAIRPSISIGKDVSTRDAYSEGMTSEQTTRDNISFSLILERHLVAHGRVSSYLGLGASMGEANSAVTYSRPFEMESGTRTGQESTNSYKSVLALIGVQWSASDAIKLGCEYKLQYRNSEQEAQEFYYEEDDRGRSSSRESFDASTSAFYIAVQF